MNKGKYDQQKNSQRDQQQKGGLNQKPQQQGGQKIDQRPQQGGLDKQKQNPIQQDPRKPFDKNNTRK